MKITMAVCLSDRLRGPHMLVWGKRPAVAGRININWLELRVIGNAMRHLVPISGFHSNLIQSDKHTAAVHTN